MKSERAASRSLGPAALVPHSWLGRLGQVVSVRQLGPSQIKQKEVPEGAPRGFRPLVLRLLPQSDVHQAYARQKHSQAPLVSVIWSTPHCYPAPASQPDNSSSRRRRGSHDASGDDGGDDSRRLA
jgi:hypothetical protein